MRLKKKPKSLFLIILIILAIILGFFSLKNILSNNQKDEIKVINKIDQYGYSLKENKPKEYEKMFKELKKILNAKKINEEEYVKKITEMFVYDFYSLNDKATKTDIGGVEFVYSEFLPNFLQNAQNTYYKYVENNIYGNRKKELQIVTDIEIINVEKEAYTYLDKTDEEAYKVNVKWDYTSSEYITYQKEANIVFIHDGIKLSLVELQ